jgi:hypothetical protein
VTSTLSPPRALVHVLARELARCRRFGGRVGLLVLRPADADEPPRRFRQRRPASAHQRLRPLERVAAQQVRGLDTVVSDPARGRLFVVVPDTGREGAAIVTDRIRRAATTTGFRVEAGAATFPDEGMALDDIVSCAQSRLDDASVRSRRAGQDAEEHHS